VVEVKLFLKHLVLKIIIYKMNIYEPSITSVNYKNAELNSFKGNSIGDTLNLGDVVFDENEITTISDSFQIQTNSSLFSFNNYDFDDSKNIFNDINTFTIYNSQYDFEKVSDNYYVIKLYIDVKSLKDFLSDSEYLVDGRQSFVTMSIKMKDSVIFVDVKNDSILHGYLNNVLPDIGIANASDIFNFSITTLLNAGVASTVDNLFYFTCYNPPTKVGNIIIRRIPKIANVFEKPKENGNSVISFVFNSLKNIFRANNSKEDISVMKIAGSNGIVQMTNTGELVSNKDVSMSNPNNNIGAKDKSIFFKQNNEDVLLLDGKDNNITINPKYINETNFDYQIGLKDNKLVKNEFVHGLISIKENNLKIIRSRGIKSIVKTGNQIIFELNNVKEIYNPIFQFHTKNANHNTSFTIVSDLETISNILIIEPNVDLTTINGTIQFSIQ